MPSLDRAGIDPDADRVVRKLTRAGYKTYLVGGCVRDLLVHRTPKDFDVATSATPNEIKATFRNSRIIGRRFRLAHVFFGSKIIETSTFRANPREDEDHDLLIRRDNVFGTETEDARRRDFTINGLFYDVEREEVIDHVGGLADLDAKLVRTIGDPEVRFQEDPVRMLRAIKFAARLEFGFEPATWRALLRWRGEISKCAPPRLLEEIHRLMRGGAARRSFELLVETGVLAVLSPYLAGLLEGPGAPTTAPPMASMAPRPTVARLEYVDEDPAEHDPDDPGEHERLLKAAADAAAAAAAGTAAVTDDAAADDDEDDDGDDAETDDDDAPDVEVDGENAGVDLDAEEQAWHRVWADEPAARPVAAAPVKLSFVEVGPELVRRRQLAWAALPFIDRAVAEGRDPSNAVAFGTILAPFLPDELRGGELHAAVQELAHPMIVQLHVTRRDSERLRYLLLAQRKLLAARKRGGQAELAGGREMIDDAVLLFELLERAAGNEPGDAPAVAPQEGRDDDAEGADGDRKRRRRRRGGRRRRRELPGDVR
ncbi:MAG: polynucleotide adenylyltransferase PcnB [Deltaproteobacteria bacterium]|nr:polynucleotide adenylyltransferase PcnB [Deltaproteobacteria bacterium]